MDPGLECLVRIHMNDKLLTQCNTTHSTHRSPRLFMRKQSGTSKLHMYHQTLIPKIMVTLS